MVINIQHPTPRLQQRDMNQRGNGGREMPSSMTPPRYIQESGRQGAIVALTQHLQRVRDVTNAP